MPHLCHNGMKLIDPVRYIKLAASGKLPTPQGLALAINGLLQQDDYKIDELVRLVQSDPALAGELLKFSNAASFGHTRPIISLSEAAITLGSRRAGTLVLALSVLHSNRGGHCIQFDYERFWSRALVTAISAHALASHSQIKADEIFTAGLLCSVGELALASLFPERYGEIISTSAEGTLKRFTLEREAFEFDKSELTASMLLEWELPEILATAVYYCEAPDAAELQEGSRLHGLTLSLHVALSLAELCVPREGSSLVTLQTLLTKAARLGINAEELSVIAEGIITSWIEWGELLQIQTRESPALEDMLASSQAREHVPSSLTLD